MLSLMSAVEAQASLGCADPSAFEGKTKLLGYESPVKGVAWQPGPMHMAVTGVWCYQIKDEAACNSAYVGQALRESSNIRNGLSRMRYRGESYLGPHERERGGERERTVSTAM